MYDGTMKNVRQQDTATEIQITRAQSEDILSARINQKTDFVYNAKTGELKIGEETFVTDAGIRDFSLLFDDVILEMTADCGTITDIFELPEIAEKFCNEKEWEYMEMCMSNRVESFSAVERSAWNCSSVPAMGNLCRTALLCRYHL